MMTHNQNQRKNANLTIRIDGEEKKQFSKIVEKIGLTPSGYLNMIVKTVLEDQNATSLLGYIHAKNNDINDSRTKKREAFEKFFQSIEDNSQEVLDDISKYRINIERNLDV